MGLCDKKKKKIRMGYYQTGHLVWEGTGWWNQYIPFSVIKCHKNVHSKTILIKKVLQTWLRHFYNDVMIQKVKKT